MEVDVFCLYFHEIYRQEQNMKQFVYSFTTKLVNVATKFTAVDSRVSMKRNKYLLKISNHFYRIASFKKIDTFLTKVPKFRMGRLNHKTKISTRIMIRSTFHSASENGDGLKFLFLSWIYEKI